MFDVQKLMMKLILIAVLATLCVVAASSDALSGVDQEKADLFQELARAESEQAGRIAEDAIWRFWLNQAPTADVRASLDAGMERRKAYDLEAAEIHLDKVVEQAPDYAEGYNQRAFVKFLRENYASAQTDLETVLEIEPNHFGALSGMYHILQIQNRRRAAMKMLQQAVTIHPWLKERSALPKTMWPESYREIHEPGQEI